MKCPKCELENPPGALRCDCGYDFPSGMVKTPCLTPRDVRQMAPLRQRRKRPRWLLYLGFALLVCTGISWLLERLIKSPRSVTIGFLICVVIVDVYSAIVSSVSRWR